MIFDLVFLTASARMVMVRLGADVKIPSARLMGAPAGAWRERPDSRTKFYNALITSTHSERIFTQG